MRAAEVVDVDLVRGVVSVAPIRESACAPKGDRSSPSNPADSAAFPPPEMSTRGRSGMRAGEGVGAGRNPFRQSSPPRRFHQKAAESSFPVAGIKSLAAGDAHGRDVCKCTHTHTHTHTHAHTHAHAHAHTHTHTHTHTPWH